MDPLGCATVTTLPDCPRLCCGLSCTRYEASVISEDYGLPQQVTSAEYTAANPVFENDYDALPDGDITASAAATGAKMEKKATRLLLKKLGREPTNAEVTKKIKALAKQKAARDSTNAAFDETEYDELPDAVVLDVHGDRPCAYVSARGNCHTVVTSGAEFCTNHRCPVCTASKPSNSRTCPSCATRSIQLGGQYHQTHPPLRCQKCG